MHTQYVAPARGLERFSCPRCAAFSHQAWRDMRVAASSSSSSMSDLYTLSAAYRVDGSQVYFTQAGDETWAASICSSCGGASVWRGSTLVFPDAELSIPPHPDMPDDARELYEEARGVLPVSRRAAAALSRAALERLLRGLTGDTKSRLDGLIADLSDQVSAPLWKVLTALRVVGNDSLHGDDDELVALYLSGDASEVVEPFFGAINAIVEELITQPAKADELYQLIPETKRLEAEKKAGKAQE